MRSSRSRLCIILKDLLCFEKKKQINYWLHLFEAFKETANEIFSSLCHFVLTILQTVKPCWCKDKVNTEQCLPFLKNHVVNFAEMKSELFRVVLTYYAVFPKLVFVFSITHIHLNGKQGEPNLPSISLADANLQERNTLCNLGLYLSRFLAKSEHFFFVILSFLNLTFQFQSVWWHLL